jgi:chorismate mutase
LTSFLDIISHTPLIISGPCSAETREQTLLAAEKLADSNKVHLFRAGIWKPRTKPGMFEGVGEPGLEWLKEVKSKTGMPTTIEVASAQHVELALKYGIDVLWIGARTTVNPFLVQEIAKAIEGTNVPVLIKNPVNPDIDLWIGAVERIQQSGLREIGLIHRGFSTYAPSSYRNMPMWQIPLDMKRRFPQIPMICDPSHICGNRTLLSEIAQKSIDLDFSGLMIEAHPDPDNAWSDAAQQILPENLKSFLDALIWRTSSTQNQELPQDFFNLRAHIDHIDDELIDMLAQRMILAEKMGGLKKEIGVTILQTERWNQILERISDRASKLGLSQDFIKRYFDAVHLESINHQNKIMNG